MLITGKNANGYRLPDFVIPGAAKSGTTTLYKLLNQHPEVFFPESKKEPFYFSFGNQAPEYTDHDFVDNLIWKTDDYLNLYRGAPQNALLGDASTSYLYHSERAIANMKALYGDDLRKVKIFIILRNPVSRAYSHYTYLVRNGFESLPFEEAILPENIEKRRHQRWGFDYLAYSMYHEQVKAYLSTFDTCEIYLTEDLADTEKVTSEIFESLNLQPAQVLRELKANPSGIPKHAGAVTFLRKNRMLKAVGNMLPASYKVRLQRSRDKVMERLMVKEPLNPATAQKLAGFFREDVEKLSALIQRDLSHWMSKTK